MPKKSTSLGQRLLKQRAKAEADFAMQSNLFILKAETTPNSPNIKSGSSQQLATPQIGTGSSSGIHSSKKQRTMIEEACLNLLNVSEKLHQKMNSFKTKGKLKPTSHDSKKIQKEVNI